MEVKEGKLTTEWEAMKSAGVWGVIGMVLGGLVSIGSTVVNVLGGPDAKAGIIAGAVVSVAALFMKTLTSLGYIRSRTEVKANGATDNVAGVGADSLGG